MSQQKENTDIHSSLAQKTPRSRRRNFFYIAAGILLFIAVIGGIILISYPNVVLQYAIEPKLKQLVADRLGRRYSLQINTITLSPNKDSLVLTGVRIADNGKTEDGSIDSTLENFGASTVLDRFVTDTVTISGLDYWKLISQKGLFSGTITIHSPKIYLRPGSLPKFAENNGTLPTFLPTISSKVIKVENAEVYFSEGTPFLGITENKKGLPSHVGGLLVKKASLEFRDFFLDETTYKQKSPTFFCKSATFHAEDISHVDSLGVVDAQVAIVEGNLIDSSLNVFSMESKKPVEEIRRIAINRLDFAGLDWYSALAGHGLHARKLFVRTPQIFLQDVANIHAFESKNSHAASDFIPLPGLLPDVQLLSIEVNNAEVYALLPQSKNVSSLKRITMKLHEFKLDHSTAFSNISTFFSRDAIYGIKGESNLTTSLGTLHLGEINGTGKSLAVSDIRLDPTIKGMKLVRLKSVEVKELDIWKLLMREGLFSAHLNIVQPDIYLNKSATPPILDFNSALTSDPLALLRDVKDYPLPLILPVVAAGSINITDGRVHGIYFFDDEKSPSLRGDSVTGIQISLNNFNLDRNSWTKKRGSLFSNAGTFSIGKVTHLSSVYRYTEGGIKGDLRRGTLTVDSASVKPLISEDSFGAVFQYRKERIDFFAPTISLHGVDYQKLFSGTGLCSDSISLNSWRMHLYGDRRKPEEERTVRDPLPHELFQKIRMPIEVKSVNLTNGGVTFRESWPDTTEPGTITLNRINAEIKHISNIQTTGNQNAPTAIEGNFKIMNAGFVNFTLGYQLMNPHLTLEINGNLGSMDASLFNNYLAETEPFTLTGNIQSAVFNISLHDSLMKGTILPLYDSLQVNFFRWDKFPPGFVSFLANALIMRTHNTPAKDHPPHASEILAELDRNASLFWALWLPVREAIGSVVHIPEWVW